MSPLLAVQIMELPDVPEDEGFAPVSVQEPEMAVDASPPKRVLPQSTSFKTSAEVSARDLE